MEHKRKIAWVPHEVTPALLHEQLKTRKGASKKDLKDNQKLDKKKSIGSQEEGVVISKGSLKGVNRESIGSQEEVKINSSSAAFHFDII